MSLRYRLTANKDGPFPMYIETPPTKVTMGKLALAKPVAVRLLKGGSKAAKRCFTRSLARRYRCKPSSVRFSPFRVVEKRIMAAGLCCDPDCMGQTDGEKIWVSTAHEMTFAEIVGTLVHEAMHFWCTVKGRQVPTEREHSMMLALGDVW